ncbi:LysR family transcriptional regulator [Tuberibacillus calidus]|jgi:LysR family transcriptional repressor of citA|uniref:LysR family transcriptional regulator n=1 Tax=Tuberibacillus calidus TaxID=340097 RepID=UPI0003FF7E2E|nr:LysR family transcriptional regulator [Tuberibacillus calidus]
MQFDWIKTFLLAAECQNFRETAEKLFITQPAVTFQIRQLEKEVGAKLFERKGRHIELTSEGNLFLKHAEKLLNDYHTALQDIENHKKGVQRTLTIAASPLVSSTQLTYILKRYMKVNPDVDVIIQVMESNMIETAVLNEQVDVGLSRQMAIHPQTEQAVISEDPVVLVVPSSHSVSDEAPINDLEDIFKQYTLITHNHPEYWDSLLRELNAQYTFKTMVATHVSTTKHFIEEGLGFSFLPHISVRREAAEGRIHIVEEHPLVLPITRTYLIKYRPNQIAREFERFVLTLMR